MPRISRPTPPAVPSTTVAARAEAPGAPRSRSSAAPTVGSDSFIDGIDPRPKSALSYEATLASHFHWPSMKYSEKVGISGPHLPAIAEAGKPFTINYGRSPDNIGLSGTLEKVELFYRVDGGPVQSAVIAEGETARAPGLRTPHLIDIPQSATGEVEYWFKLTTTDGQTHWDSQFGQNYRTNIVPAGGSVLRFDDLWGETLSAPIKAGGTLRLAYDVDRIKPFLRGTSHRGAATWGAYAHVSFDGKPAQKIPITAVRYGEYGGHAAIEPVIATVEVPKDAKSVSIWIEGYAYAGNAWDSDHGKNYTFPVQP